MGRRRRRQQRSEQKQQAPGSFPAAFANAVGHWDRILPTLGSNPDLTAEVERRRAQLNGVFEPVDAVALLGQLVVTEMPMSAETYVESEHVGSAYVIEFAAALLVSRGNRHGASEPGRAIDANTLQPTQELIAEIALLEGLRRYQGAGALASGDPLSAAQGRAAVADLMLRGPGWPWQETEALSDLFAPFAGQLKTDLGFDAADAVACTDAAADLVARQVADHMATASEYLDEALAWADQALGGWQSQPPTPIRDQALTMLWALMHVGDAMLIRSAALATAANVSPETALAYLNAFATPFGQTDPLMRVAERIRFAPYIQVSADEYFLTVAGNDLWALRPLLEQSVKGERYARHRGRWLENRAVDLLANALAPDTTYKGLRLVDPDRGTSLGEIDGLLRFGDTVLLIEAKAASMRPGARRGGQALQRHLKETLGKASEQNSVALDVLLGRRPAIVRDSAGEVVDFGQGVREVHPILVTLDDLSAVAPVVWEMAGSGVLPAGATIPWIVTLHELDLVCQTVSSPVQFVHFLRRRSRLNEIGGLIASDELDWWMLYLKSGLYFEDDPAGRAVRYLSQTDDLDAWVLFQRGLRQTPAEKPSQQLDQGTEEIIQCLEDERPPGWMAAGCTVLEASGKSQKELGRALDKARRRARKRGLVQRGTYGYSSGTEPMLICFVVVPDDHGSTLAHALENYVSERLEEAGLQRVLGLGLVASTERPYDALLVLERGTWN